MDEFWTGKRTLKPAEGSLRPTIDATRLPSENALVTLVLGSIQREAARLPRLAVGTAVLAHIAVGVYV